MRITGVAELKATLSEHLSRVKAGEEILITERGRPIAKIVPLASTSLEEGVQELIRKGLVRPPKKAMEASQLEKLLAATPADPEGSVLAALVAERREGR
jgi:prevent-host-death family protein